MRNLILQSVRKGIDAITTLGLEDCLNFIESVSWAIIDTYRHGKKLLLAGNGGSLCDAMHFAEELTGCFRKPRKALPAIALADPGHITCVGNDMGFDAIFARGIEAHGSKGDLFVLLTTSGNSKNLLEAIKVAKKRQLTTVAFLGRDGGAIKGLCDYEWIVSGFDHSDRIQEAHITAVHIIIEMVERELFFSEEEIEIAGAS